MPEVAHVSLVASNGDRPLLELRGGDPKGRDVVHRIVTGWPGWRRLPGPGKLGDRLCSVYQAPAWAAQALALAACRTLQLIYDDGARGLVDRATAAHSEAARELARPHPNLPGATLWPTARRPLPHQTTALRAARLLGYDLLLADDMGLGKTSTALWCADDARAHALLIVCPVSVKWNWAKEIEATLGPKWITFVIEGSRKQRASQLAEIKGYARMASPQRQAIVINYDLLPHLTDEQLTQLAEHVQRGFLILDESHYVKNRNAKRSKLCRWLGETSKHRLLLSGTPVRNTIDDLWQQLEIARPGAFTSYHDFQSRFLVVRDIQFATGKRPVTTIVGTKNVKELNAVVNTLQIRRRKDDVLDLPPKTHTFPELELCDVTRPLYHAMRDFARIELSKLGEDTLIFDPRARSGIEAALRCEQLAQGFIGGVPEPIMEKLGKALKHAHKIAGRPGELLFPRAPKIVWLLEAIHSVLGQGGQAVVFSRFNAPLFWLNTELAGNGVGLLFGGVPGDQRQAAIEEFQSGKTKILLCQVRVAEGFNLTASQDVLFLGRDWSPAVNRQAEDRCHRIGQTGTVNVQVPIVRGTVETMIDKKLKAKNADAEQALKTVTVRELMEAL